MATTPTIDANLFWRAVSMRPVGATVVTTQHGVERSGFLGLSFAHVSADPPTVLVSVSRSTSALSTLKASEAFAVSLLPAGSSVAAKEFGGAAAIEERFSGRSWEKLVTGAPVLSNAAVAFDCRLHRLVEDDGAVIALGRVVALRFGDEAGATIAYRGSYQDIARH